MAYLPGTGIQLGVGREGTRGTYQAPSIYVPAREPVTLRQVMDKIQVRETSGGTVASTGSVISQKRAEGDFVANLRSKSIGYFLLSLFGKVTTSTSGAGYSHLFELLAGNPQYPTLSFALAQDGFQDYKYTRGMVREAEFRFPVDDLVNFTAALIAAAEATQSTLSPSLADSDLYFRPQDVEFKIAAAVGDLAGASVTKLKELTFTVGNGARPNQNISEVTPSDILAIMHEISGRIVLDYQDETFHDIVSGNTVKAMQIKLERSDIDLGGGLTPKLTFTFPQVNFDSYDPDRPLDEIVREGLGFTVHHDLDAGYAARATLVNDQANYTT